MSQRLQFTYFARIATRWGDNDFYGHVNNMIYYSYIDNVVLDYLMSAGGFDIHDDPVIDVCVENGCRYKASFAYPETIKVGLLVAHIGRTSVRYELGFFPLDGDQARVEAHFVHVFVDRKTMTPAPIPQKIRDALVRLQPGSGQPAS